MCLINVTGRLQHFPIESIYNLLLVRVCNSTHSNPFKPLFFQLCAAATAVVPSIVCCCAVSHTNEAVQLGADLN